jgi:hypothetical protein
MLANCSHCAIKLVSLLVQVLRQIEERPGLNELTQWLLHFLRAEHSRRVGEVWPIIDEMEITSQERRRVGYPFALYYQATAWQPGRASDDAVERFCFASRFFSRDLPDDESLNIRHFLADCMRLGEAAWGGVGPLWDESRQVLARRLRPHLESLLDQYYANVFNALGPSPDRAFDEGFLQRVPFFLDLLKQLDPSPLLTSFPQRVQPRNTRKIQKLDPLKNHILILFPLS